MDRVLFGAASSPFMLSAVLKRLFLDLEPSISANTYMDDILLSTDSIPALRSLIDRLEEVHRKGSFKLHKWNTNPWIDQELHLTVATGKSACLGVEWDRINDYHFFSSHYTGFSSYTPNVSFSLRKVFRSTRPPRTMAYSVEIIFT